MPAPATTKINLTQHRADRLARSPEPGVVWDVRMPGLGVRGRSWIVRVHPRGGRKIVRTIGKLAKMSVADARVEAGKVAAEIEAGEHGQVRAVTVARLVDHYQSHHRTRKKGRLAGEDRDTRRRCDLLVERWGRRRADAIDHSDVAVLLDEINARGSFYEANRTRALIRSIWNEGRVWRFVPAGVPNPVAGTPVNRERTRDVAALTVAQVQALVEAAQQLPNRWAGAAICVLILTGARRGEVLSLKWDDLDLDTQLVVFRDRKAGDDLELPLAPAAVELLAGIERVPGSAWVFPSPTSKSGHIESLRGPWATAIKAAGLPAGARMHDVRAAAATAISAAAGIRAAQQVLGHADPRTTLRYVRPSADDRRAALEGFAAAVIGGRARGAR